MTKQKEINQTKKDSKFRHFLWDFCSIKVNTVPYTAKTDVLNLLRLAVASAKTEDVKEAIEELVEIVNKI